MRFSWERFCTYCKYNVTPIPDPGYYILQIDIDLCMFVFRKKKFEDVRMGTCILNFLCIEVNLNRTIFKTTTNVSSSNHDSKGRNSNSSEWSVVICLSHLTSFGHIFHTRTLACSFLSIGILWCYTDARRAHWSLQFNPVNVFIAWNVPLITAKQIRPFCYAKRDHCK